MTAPIIIRQEGLGASMRRSFEPLLRALQQRQQTQLQQQQLALQQRVAAADIEASQARTEELRLQGEQRQKELDDAAKASKIFQTSLDRSEGKFNQAMIADMFAQAKTPGQVQALAGMIPGFGQALGAGAQVRTAQAQASTAETGAEAAQVGLERQRVALSQDERIARIASMDETLRTRAQRFATRLLENPTAALPKDPNLREAVGMQMLEILPFLSNALDREATGATGSTAALIFARQQAMQAVSGATRAYAERLNLAVDEEEIAEIPSPTSREGLTPFLPPGMDYSTTRRLIRAATEQALETLGEEPPTSISGFPEFDRMADFARMDPEIQQNIVTSAHNLAAGGDFAPGSNIPSRHRALIRRLARLIQQQQQQQQ